MLKINRKLSKKGFTLIELMVAIAILALAALGIFQAYTTGFQVMADAKDRTVATNIAQKKLEEIKNSVSVDYPYYSIETQEINEKTYTIVMATNSIEYNLEQVYVTVSWKDRNGNEKNVQLETLIYDLKTIIVEHPDVGRIHLSADPTELTCCVEGETSTITAELFNTANPEQRVPSGTPVRFNVDNGSVDPEFAVTDTIGKATTQLTLSGKNTASVTANSGTKSSIESENPLEISCVPKASEIVLSASPSSITPEKSSEITATVTDTCGDELPGESDQVVVTFNTNNGSFNGSTTTTDTTDIGIATVVLNNMEIATVATVVGTITVDEVDISDSTTVICTNYSISVSAYPTSINPGGDDDRSTINAELTQSGGGTDVDGKSIIFKTDKGFFVETDENTVKIETDGGEAVATLFSLSGGDIATITASYEITPGNTISDTTTVQCTEYIISIIANPDKVIPGSPSTITATLTDYEGDPAANKGIAFYSSKGILIDDSVYTDSNGIAVTTLTLDNVGDIANVSANYGFASDSVNVKCIEFILELTVNPASITPGESSVITATLTKYPNILFNGGNITFTTKHGTFENGQQTITAITGDTQPDGQAVVNLTLNIVGTTAIVTAKYIIGENTLAEDTVTVECSDAYITLNSPSNIDFWEYLNYNTRYSIRFDLFLHGGPITVEKVKIEWEGYPTRYRRIWIRQPISGGSRTIIYEHNYANKGNIENLDTNYTISANSSFRVFINFSYYIDNKHIILTFNPDDPNAEEKYQVVIDTPNW